MADIPIIFSAPMVRAKQAGRKTQTRRFAWGPRFKPGAGHSGDGSPAGWCWGVWRKGECAWPTPKMLRKLGLDPQADQLTGYMAPSSWQAVKPGDRLWVRENFQICRVSENYESGGDTCIFEWEDDLYGDPRDFLGGSARFGTRAQVFFAAADEDDIPVEFTELRSIDGKQLLHEREIGWRPSIHMPRWASRLTSVVTATKIEPLQKIDGRDAIAEGLVSLGRDGENWHWDPEAEHGQGYFAPWRAFRALWQSLHGDNAWAANPDVVALTFTVHQVNIDQLAREAA